MRPIDGNELHSEIQRMICSPEYASIEALNALTDVLLVISKTPTIPVQHGQWKYGYCKEAGMRCYFCTTCGKEAYWDTDYGQQLFDYCPKCGSHMSIGEKK